MIVFSFFNVLIKSVHIIKDLNIQDAVCALFKMQNLTHVLI